MDEKVTITLSQKQLEVLLTGAAHSVPYITLAPIIDAVREQVVKSAEAGAANE